MEVLKAKEKMPSSINNILITNYNINYKRHDIKKKPIIYPDRDGKRMSDNTKQFNWIVKIKENLERMFADNQNIFIAGDLLWYPVEGDNKTRTAPDAMVVFGRPKGHRGSYKSWEEDNIAPQVVFEILSPGNTPKEMKKKLKFYEKYGVKEYYEYDPDKIKLKGWFKIDDKLEAIEQMQGFISPLLNIKFEILKNDLSIFFPDGSPFLTSVELDLLRIKENQKAVSAEERAEVERLKAISAEERAKIAEEKAYQMAIKLKELGIDF